MSDSLYFRAVEDLRYQHMYHPVSVEQKCPALAYVLNQVSAGIFGDGGVYEPYVTSLCQRRSIRCNLFLLQAFEHHQADRLLSHHRRFRLM